jgi:hypothetical protein
MDEMRLWGSVLVGALAVLSLVTPGSAAAQGARVEGARDPIAAEALFRDARRLITEGKFAEACPKLAESERLDPASGTVLNLAECQEKLGSLATAWENWHKALDQLPVGDERIPLAEQHAAALEPRLPHLQLYLAPNAPPDTYVRRDGVELHDASFNIPLPVDPGDHVLTFLAEGHSPVTQKVTLAEAQSLSVEVAPGPLLPVSLAPARPSHTLWVAGWITASVGVASFIGAAVTGGVILEDKSTANAMCVQVCMGTGASAVSSGKMMLAVNAVFWGVGIAGVAGGTTMIILGRRRHGGEAVPTVGAALGPGSVLVRGTF